MLTMPAVLAIHTKPGSGALVFPGDRRPSLQKRDSLPVPVNAGFPGSFSHYWAPGIWKEHHRIPIAHPFVPEDTDDDINGNCDIRGRSKMRCLIHCDCLIPKLTLPPSLQL